MDILIVGGSGHVSGTLARMAIRAGHSVWTVTRGERPITEGVRSLIADRHIHGAMEACVSDQQMIWDLVIDCICFDLEDIRQDIDLFRDRARHFVMISTDFVYDPVLRTFPQTEESSHFVVETDGIMAYGGKKRQCEEALESISTNHMAWTILRPCHIYGPTSRLGCLPHHGRDPELIKRLKEGEALNLVGGGYFLQQPVLAEDLSLTILSVAGASKVHGMTLNVAGPDVIESWEYYRIIADALNEKLEIEETPVRAYLESNPRSAPFLCHRTYDLDRLIGSGLYVPDTPIADGLRYHVSGLRNG